MASSPTDRGRGSIDAIAGKRTAAVRRLSAFADRAWEFRGYQSWNAYCGHAFADDRPRPLRRPALQLESADAEGEAPTVC